MTKSKKKILYSIPLERNESFIERFEKYKNDLLPGHFLFGASDLEHLGYDIIYSTPDNISKIKGFFSMYYSIIKYTINIIRKSKTFDLIYSPYPNFLDFIIYLRALKLFPKKIIIIQHCTIEKKRSFLSYIITQKLYYMGADKIIFFDKKSAYDSLKSGIISEGQIFIETWGPDVEQYKRIKDRYENRITNKRISFISTGRDSRDFELMFDAFKGLEVSFELYLMDIKLVEKYKGKCKNIHVYHLESTKDSPQIALNATLNSDVSIIICKPTRPTSNGYTALCEAMGLGKPVILTKNPFIPIDVDKEKFGITVPVGDIDALRSAILTFYNNPEMIKEYGSNARKFAEEKWNSKILANQLDSLFQIL